MTADGLAESPARGAGRQLAHILSVCDRELGEVGRRGHLFAWLRSPEAGTEGWLPVDAYYPRARLVVLYRARRGPHDQLYRERIPQHGLRLLELTPSDVGATAVGVERAVAERLATLAPASESEEAAPARKVRWPTARNVRWPSFGRLRPSSGRTEPEAEPKPRVPTTAVERGSRFVTSHRGAMPVRTRESPAIGIVVGLGLLLLLAVAAAYVASVLGG
jgi:hypothetical protein